MKRVAKPWIRFLLRASAMLAGALVVFLAIFFLADWLLPRVTRALAGDDPSDSLAALAKVLEDFGAWGFAGLAVSAVFWLLSPWVDRARPRAERDATTATPRHSVFGLIPARAWCFQSRPGDETRIAAGLTGDGVRIVALEGERGVGKTQLAADQARRAEADGFELVAWINAERGLVPELARLAEQLGLRRSPAHTDEELAEYARQHLETRDGARRFVVFDNVENPDQLRPYLPAVGAARVIITTNRREFATMAGITAIRIETYDPGQGLEFLTSATGLPASDDARTVGAALGWLPLGLAQAAAYIRQNALDYGRYATELASQSLDATLSQQAGADHPGVLSATKLSLDGLVRDDPSGLSLRLLTLLCTLSPDGVSRSYLDAPGAAAFGPDADLARTLSILSRSSLVTITSSAGVGAGEADDATAVRDTAKITVHRLTARVIRFQADRGRDPGLRQSIATATVLLQTVADSIPADGVARHRSELDELGAHLDAVRAYALSDPALLRLSARVGALLGTAGDLAQAVRLLESTLAIYREQVGPHDPVTLATANTLAGAYLAVGRGGEAVALYGATLAARERVLGPDDRETLASRNNLARAYAWSGRLAVAITLHEGTLAARERVLGPTDPDTLTSRNDLASAYRANAEFDRAIELYQETLAARERVLGADHPDTLTSRNDLAVAHRASGQAVAAIALHTATLADRMRVLGADHPDTLASASDLGSAYRAHGQLKQAVAQHRQALAARERVLGPDHPETLASRNNLGASLEQRGRLRSALAQYRSALAGCLRVLGESSPDTVAVKSNVERAGRARRRQRVRRVLLGATAGVTAVGCLVGFAALSVQVIMDEAEQAARTTQVVAPPTLAGRALVAGEGEIERELASAARAEQSELMGLAGVHSAVVAFYGMPQRDLIYVKAFTTAVYLPNEWLADLIDENPRNRMQDIDAGPRGGVAACGTEVLEAVDGTFDVVSCRWADSAGTGQILWYNQSLDVARSEFVTMRGQIEVPRVA